MLGNVDVNGRRPWSMMDDDRQTNRDHLWMKVPGGIIEGHQSWIRF